MATSPLARSRPKVGRGYLGPHPTPLWDILRRAWEEGISVQSNYARAHAPEVALAASLGWISTVTLDGLKFTGSWNITAEGVSAYNHHDRGEA